MKLIFITPLRLICILLTILSLYSHGQINVGGEPYSFAHPTARVAIQDMVMPSIDMAKLQEEDEQDAQNGLPPRFGYPHDVQMDLSSSGTWSTLKGGDRLWRLTITCPGAISVNLLYDRFWLPKGGRFYVYNQTLNHVLGGFTEINNKGTHIDPGKFATGLVYGETITLEYFEPAEVAGKGIISIDYIVHGYRSIGILSKFENSESFGGSGNCQVNINCPEGNNWQEEKTGVALSLNNGIRWCSGSLVNNTRQDGTPYLLTADHCLPGGVDAISNPDLSYWSFYWNYESPGCSDGIDFIPLSTNGATLVANNANSDFALLLLDESPLDLPLDPYFNGWDRRNVATSNGVGIHHPSGDIKKIATHTITPASSSTIPPGPDNNYWQVRWSATANGFSVTENVSSGSPLFNANSHIIGQLYGGSSINCADPPNDPGVYGKIYASWNGSSDSRRRLRDWLDPDNLGLNVLDGVYAGCPSDLTITSGISSGTQVFQVSNSITATNIVSGNANVTYDAGQRVTLAPNFHARAGTAFSARIGGCNPAATTVLRESVLARVSHPPASHLDLNDESMFSVFPNPSHGIFTVKMDGKVDKENVDKIVEIYNLRGNLVFHGVVEPGGELRIDISEQPKALYLLKIHIEGDVITQKLIVE